MPRDYELLRNDYSFMEKVRLIKSHISGPSDRYEMTAPVEIHSVEELNKIKGRKIIVTFLGDVMPIGKHTLEVSSEIEKLIHEADIIVLNLEGILNYRPRMLALRHTDKILDELEKLAPKKKFLINCANNHAGDFGKEKFRKSYEILKKRGFRTIGRDDEPTAEIENINFCAFSEWSNQRNPGINYIKSSKEKLSKYIKKDKCNILLPHWGYELERYPSPQQIETSKALLAEWDAIIGAHSHIPQAVSSYSSDEKKKLVAYSLGNFCFLSYIPIYQKGCVLQAEFGKDESGKWRAGTIKYKRIIFKPRYGKIRISPYVRNSNLLYKIRYFIFKELKYVLVLFWIIGYGIRHLQPIRSFSKINSDLPNGGKCTLPKSAVYDYFTKNNKYAKEKFVPLVKLPAGISWREARDKLEKINGEPVVFKPDRGIRSIGVRILNEDWEKQALLSNRGKVDYVAQKFVSFPHELGVFYIKYPGWNSGKIMGIAYLEFRKIIGDGKKSIQQLLDGANATPAMKAYVKNRFKNMMQVPKTGEEISLVNVSGHGSEERYYNREDLITPEVTDSFNSLVGKNNFRFGRFDVRAENLEEFKKGKFVVLEANSGPDAIALHALDPEFSASKKLKIFIQEYRHAFAIAKKINEKIKIGGWAYFWFFVGDQIMLSKLKRRLKSKKI